VKRPPVVRDRSNIGGERILRRCHAHILAKKYGADRADIDRVNDFIRTHAHPGIHTAAPVQQNRCAVYESNAATLGKIDYPALIKKTVSVMLSIRS
jgi:hypothetical protein